MEVLTAFVAVFLKIHFCIKPALSGLFENSLIFLANGHR